ncbi:MAG: recombination mediator RecR [Phycisphaerales bacterium JB039]
MSSPDAHQSAAESTRAGPVPASAGAGGAYPETVERLITEFGRLPGIGRRSAERLAFWTLKSDPETALGLARAIEAVKRQVRHCSVCANLSDGDRCAICAGAARGQRDAGLVLVVEQPRDLIALEQTGLFSGVYHVLMGRISPLDGIGPGDLTIPDLLRRAEDPSANAAGVAVREVILGLNPTLEGDGTALYLAEQLRLRGVKVSRLARGLPTGSQLEFASKAVLADAIEGRRDV